MKTYIYSVAAVSIGPGKQILIQTDEEFDTYKKALHSVNKNRSEQFLIIKYEKISDSYIGGHIISIQPKITNKDSEN